MGISHLDSVSAIVLAVMLSAEGSKQKLTFKFDAVRRKQILTTAGSLNEVAAKDAHVASSAAAFFAGSFVAPPEKDKLVILPTSFYKKEVLVETIHISCQSDMYQPGRDYGGVIIYQYNDKSEWRTANNTHCKTGYIVIQDVKRWKTDEPGVVHGAVYRNAFGESVNDAEVVGEGFAFRRNGKFEMCSGVFNNPPGSVFHDHRRNCLSIASGRLWSIGILWRHITANIHVYHAFDIEVK